MKKTILTKLNFRRTYNFLTIFVAIALLIEIGSRLNTYVETCSFQKPSESQNVEPVSHWKTYTNHTYNYQLKYPSNIFTCARPERFKTVQFWSNRRKTTPPIQGAEDDLDRLILYISILDENYLSEEEERFYKDTIGENNQSENKKPGLAKLSDITTNGVQGAVYFHRFRTRQNAYAYHAVWYVDRKYYKLYLGAANKEKAEAQVELFNQVLSTFKFLKK